MVTMLAKDAKRKSLADFPELAEAQQKFYDVQAELAAQEKVIDSINSRASVGIKTQAERYLDGDESPSNDKESRQQEINAAYAHRVILQQAVEIQKKRLSELRWKCITEVREAHLGEHKVLASKVGAALSQLKAALLDEAKFRDKLQRDGVETCFPLEFAGWNRAGDINLVKDEIFLIDFWFKDMTERGYL